MKMKIQNLFWFLGREPFFQTREEYLEEVECSALLHEHLFDEVWESIEASSVLLESLIPADWHSRPESLLAPNESRESSESSE